MPTEIINPKDGKVLAEVQTIDIDRIMSMLDRIKKTFGLKKVIVRRF